MASKELLIIGIIPKIDKLFTIGHACQLMEFSSLQSRCDTMSFGHINSRIPARNPAQLPDGPPAPEGLSPQTVYTDGSQRYTGSAHGPRPATAVDLSTGVAFKTGIGPPTDCKRVGYSHSRLFYTIEKEVYYDLTAWQKRPRCRLRTLWRRSSSGRPAPCNSMSCRW